MKKLILLVTIMVVGVVATACDHGLTGSGEVIKVGSKDFTENLIVSEIYALAMEDEGYNVERVFNISSSVIHDSIVAGEVDLYPEYTGTGLITVLGRNMETNPDEVYAKVKAEYERKYNITWLPCSKANDGQGLVIKTSVAEKYGIKTISDLQANAAKLRFASQGEFDYREDGIPALTKVYGEFNWLSSKVYDNALKYAVLDEDKADVAPAYTTEGQLVNKDKYTLLVDDKGVWPPYNLAPIVRDDVLDEHTELAELLIKISSTFTTDNITSLNAKVDVDKEEYEDVAKEYYNSIKDKL